ncbi:uncharacterized protein HaLaN_15553, partial [Haematococcus lacustris]
MEAVVRDKGAASCQHTGRRRLFLLVLSASSSGRKSGKGDMVSAQDSEAVCYINGKRWVLPPGRGETTLLAFLRDIGLTGTKLGCGEVRGPLLHGRLQLLLGGCGACTVMLSHWEAGQVVHRSANACLCPLYAVEGMHVVTVEGIGNTREGLHPVQERLAKAHGSQCGFCTPGFVMSMYSLLRSSSQAPSEEQIEDALGGNLCRCTGYRPILDAFRVFAKSDPKAYTEDAIAAAKGLMPAHADTNGHAASNGHSDANGHTACNGATGNGASNGSSNGSSTASAGGR